MKKKKFLKIIGIGLASLMALTLILLIHIYSVYKPKAPNAYSKVMARIDIDDSLNQAKVSGMETWFYRQKGIDHVLVNPENRLVIFTFFPLKTSGNRIVENFKSHFKLKAHRFLPNAEDLKKSCPVSGSFGFKIYQTISQVF